jgi:hypothetical protein
VTDTSHEPKPPDKEANSPKPRRRWWRIGGVGLLVIVVMLVIARAMLPGALQWYVNRTIDQNPLYDGKIGDIDVSLWRGAYTIKDVRLVKTTGNVPVPLFQSKRLDLAIEWKSLLNRKIVGRVAMEQPELNFVDSGSKSEGQTGAGGPWLEIIQDLFPFKINSLHVNDGTMHFRAFDTDPPVDLFINHLNASIENLTNIHNDVTPLVATVTAKGLAMGHAPLEYKMKFDPFSYRPTFQVAVRLIGLDVTKTNQLTRAYGAFDFEHGWFDLVVELDAKEGQLEGYIKPLFRNLKVLSLKQDIKEDNVIEFFWEALVGVTTELLKNQPRDQFGTVINFRGDVMNPKTSILEVVGNVLRNAFIRAYLPRLRGDATQIEGLEFSPGSVSDPVTPIGD